MERSSWWPANPFHEGGNEGNCWNWGAEAMLTAVIDEIERRWDSHECDSFRQVLDAIRAEAGL